MLQNTKNVKMQTRLFATISLGGLLLSTLLCGCSTPRLTDFHPDATASTVRIGREAGVEIALDPFVEPQRTRQFFGIDAVANGIGIVFARISNNTTDQILLVEKKDFQFHFAGVSSGQNADIGTSERYGAAAQRDRDAAATARSSEYDNVVGAITAENPTPVALIDLAKATEVQRNLLGKEMPDQTLAPGQSMEGFIYYRIAPNEREWFRGATMRINLTDTTSHEPVSLTIPLSQ
ncbi:MAG: hypothetical protein ACLPT4_04210 [Verrucomicrobiia bacterium]